MLYSPEDGPINLSTNPDISLQWLEEI